MMPNLSPLPVIAGQAGLTRVISHFLKTKPDWRLEHFVLKSNKLPGRHTAEHLAEAIKECMHRWRKEGARGVKPPFISRVFSGIQFFTIENFSC